MTSPWLWAVAVAASATLAVVGHAPRRRLLHLIFKPATTALILGATVTLGADLPGKPWIIGGLLLAGLGDVLLMWQERLFVAGLGAFLLALLAYAIGFTLGVPWTWIQFVYLLLPGVLIALVLPSLWPKLGRLRVPVTAYAVVIMAMSWRAISRFDAPDVSLLSWLAGFAGALLFPLGDILLARRRFLKRPVPYGVELGVYYLAQWLLCSTLWL